MRALVLALALLVSSCGTSRIGVRIEGSFSDEQRAELYRAAEEWNYKANVMFDLDDEDGDYVIVQRDADHMPITSTAYGTKVGHVVTIRRGLEGDELRLVAMHELGHVLSIKHVEGDAVMNVEGRYHDGLAVPELSSVDIDACRRVGACN